jgi:hypothetical protein
MLRRSFLMTSAAAVAQPQTFPVGVRRGHVLVYDTRRQELLLFGGLYPSDASGSEPLWICSRGKWRQVPGVGPRARGLPGGAYDSDRGRFVVYGGIGGMYGSRFADVWEWDGSAWREATLQGPGPGPRDHHAMCYDPVRKRIVLHGGSVAITFHTSSGEIKTGAEHWYDETWEYDGTVWKALASPGPGAKAHHCMAYDPVRRVSLMLGGVSPDRQRHGETWGWDGRSWTKLAEGGPAPRSRSRMAFHEPSSQMVLYGGDAPNSGRGFKVVGDTWVWDGKQWTEWKPRNSPGPRFMHAMAYAADLKRVVLYGGLQNAKDRDDVWEWDGEDWKQSGLQPVGC